jgi:hypothetical protein
VQRRERTSIHPNPVSIQIVRVSDRKLTEYCPCTA